MQSLSKDVKLLIIDKIILSAIVGIIAFGVQRNYETANKKRDHQNEAAKITWTLTHASLQKLITCTEQNLDLMSLSVNGLPLNNQQTSDLFKNQICINRQNDLLSLSLNEDLRDTSKFDITVFYSPSGTSQKKTKLNTLQQKHITQISKIHNALLIKAGKQFDQGEQ